MQNHAIPGACALAVLTLAVVPALAQPTFGNPSPTAGTSTSQ